MAVMRVAVKTNPGINNGRIDQRGKSPRQKFAQTFFVCGSYLPLIRIRGRFAPRSVIGYFDDPFPAEGKAIIARRRNIGAKNRKQVRREETWILWFEMKDRMAGRTKEIAGKREEMRRPRAHGHDDR